MNALAAGLLGGILIALAAPMAWQAGASGLVAACAAAAMACRCRAFGFTLLAGLLLAQAAAQRVLTAPYDCGERRLVRARIESIPAPQGSGWQYDAWVEAVAEPRYAPLRVRVSHAGAGRPASGELWQLLLQFDQPAGGAAADAGRRALLRDHVSATARVRESPLNRLLAAPGPSLDGLRAAVADRIQARVDDPSAAALLAALAVGVTGDVSALQWRVFSATGITHLVAISGMHVTFFALLCMAMARVLWRRWAWLGARVRRESFVAVVGTMLAFGYALLSGFSVPAQRTALMLTVFLAARCLGREVAPMWSVSASLVAVLTIDPLAVLSAGFWLSFCAVASIIVVAGGRVQAPGAVRAAVLVQWVVTVALLPVTAALFGSFSAVGPLVNAAAIPLFTFSLVPPVLVATALYLIPLGATHWCADHLVDVAAWVAQQAWPWLVSAANLPGASWSAAASLLWLVLALPSAVCVLAPLPVTMRIGALAILCSGFLARSPRPAAGNLELVMFDVGPSRAVLLRTTGHQLLLGVGESFGTAGRRFERVVLPELLRGAGVLDLILDRADRDSMQGLALAQARLPPRLAFVASGKPPPELLPCTGRRWRWDEVSFVLHPTADGCWLEARAGGRQLVVAPSRLPSGRTPEIGLADVQVLPRRARDAAALMKRTAAGALLLASLSPGEWQSGGWRAVREARGAGSQTLWATPNHGNLHLTLRADGRLVRPAGPGRQFGVWSQSSGAGACPAP